MDVRIGSLDERQSQSSPIWTKDGIFVSRSRTHSRTCRGPVVMDGTRRRQSLAEILSCIYTWIHHSMSDFFGNLFMEMFNVRE